MHNGGVSWRDYEGRQLGPDLEGLEIKGQAKLVRMRRWFFV